MTVTFSAIQFLGGIFVASLASQRCQVTSRMGNVGSKIASDKHKLANLANLVSPPLTLPGCHFHRFRSESRNRIIKSDELLNTQPLPTLMIPVAVSILLLKGSANAIMPSPMIPFKDKRKKILLL